MKSVTYVPERLLPISPVYTEGNFRIIDAIRVSQSESRSTKKISMCGLGGLLLKLLQSPDRQNIDSTSGQAPTATNQIFTKTRHNFLTIKEDEKFPSQEKNLSHHETLKSDLVVSSNKIYIKLAVCM